MDASTRAWIDQEDAWIKQVIRERGWAIIYVGGDQCSRQRCDHPPGEGPPFAYTVGMFGLGHPELLAFGLPTEAVIELFNDVGDRIRQGSALAPGFEIEFERWQHKVVPEEVPNPEDIVFEANRFYQRPLDSPVPVLQLTYDDGNGVYPWDKDYPTPEMQPRPGTFAA